tara:strand:+ start:718 stop:963 length:246 start_codon:yes stop_codon:yes gene_type:complete
MNIRARHLLHLNLNQSKILLSLVKKEYKKSESLNFDDLYYQADLLELLSKLTKKIADLEADGAAQTDLRKLNRTKKEGVSK